MERSRSLKPKNNLKLKRVMTKIKMVREQLGLRITTIRVAAVDFSQAFLVRLARLVPLGILVDVLQVITKVQIQEYLQEPQGV